MDVTKPYKFIGFGAMDVTKPQTPNLPSPSIVGAVWALKQIAIFYFFGGPKPLKSPSPGPGIDP